jgi:hypothetical protein
MKIPVTKEIGCDLDQLNKRMKFMFHAAYMMMHLQESGYIDITDTDICGFLEETSVLEEAFSKIQERLMKVGEA